MKQTAVLWHALKSDDLRGKFALGAITAIEYYEELNIILKVALEMEKQQIIDAHIKGHNAPSSTIKNYDAEQYYNEQYKK